MVQSRQLSVFFQAHSGYASLSTSAEHSMCINPQAQVSCVWINVGVLSVYEEKKDKASLEAGFHVGGNQVSICSFQAVRYWHYTHWNSLNELTMYTGTGVCPLVLHKFDSRESTVVSGRGPTPEPQSVTPRKDKISQTQGHPTQISHLRCKQPRVLERSQREAEGWSSLMRTLPFSDSCVAPSNH